MNLFEYLFHKNRTYLYVRKLNTDTDFSFKIEKQNDDSEKKYIIYSMMGGMLEKRFTEIGFFNKNGKLIEEIDSPDFMCFHYVIMNHLTIFENKNLEVIKGYVAKKFNN